MPLATQLNTSCLTSSISRSVMLCISTALNTLNVFQRRQVVYGEAPDDSLAELTGKPSDINHNYGGE